MYPSEFRESAGGGFNHTVTPLATAIWYGLGQMNTHSTWQSRMNEAGGDLFAPPHSLAAMDNLTRTFNSARLPADMLPTTQKSLRVYQLQQLLAMAPAGAEGQAQKVAVVLDELLAAQTAFRGYMASGHRHGQGYAGPHNNRIVEALHQAVIELHDAPQNSITAQAVAQALQSDRENGLDLQAFPVLRAKAGILSQQALAENFAEHLWQALLAHKKPSGLVTSTEDFRDATRAAVQAYYDAGGDVATRDPQLHETLQHIMHGEPGEEELRALPEKVRHMSHRIEQYHTPCKDLILAYKHDRRSIRQALHDGSIASAENPLTQRSALLDLVYAARWERAVEKIRDAIYQDQEMLANASIKADPDSRAVQTIVNDTRVTAQRGGKQRGA